MHAAVPFLGRELGETLAAAAAVSALIPWLATGVATTAGQAKRRASSSSHTLHSVFPTLLLGGNRASKFSANEFL